MLRRLDELESVGAHCYIPRGDRNYAMDVGIRGLASRGVLKSDGKTLSINPDDRPLLQYYANAIWHLG